MIIEDKKERGREEKCKLILDITSDIIITEGIEKLSIRKIAKRIEYSPTLIYHYFKDKDDIVMQFLSNRYMEMIKKILIDSEEKSNSIEKLKYMIYSYIKVALEMQDVYKAVMLSSDTRILEYTSVLFKGACKDRKLMSILYGLVKDVTKENNIDEEQIEIIVQVIWTSIFGLIIRIITEKDLPENQIKQLIKNHVDTLFDKILLIK